MRKLSLFILLITGCNAPTLETTLQPVQVAGTTSATASISPPSASPIVIPSPSPSPSSSPSPIVSNHFIYVLGSSITSYEVNQLQVDTGSVATTSVSSGALLTLVDSRNEYLLVLGSKLDIFRIDSSHGQLTWMATISSILNPMQVKSINFNPDHLGDIVFNGLASGHTFSVDYSSTNPSQSVTLDETAYPYKATYSGTPLYCVGQDRWGYKIMDDTYKNVFAWDTWKSGGGISTFVANGLKSISCL